MHDATVFSFLSFIEYTIYHVHLTPPLFTHQLLKIININIALHSITDFHVTTAVLLDFSSVQEVVQYTRLNNLISTM